MNEHIDQDPELLDLIKRQERLAGYTARVQYDKLSEADFELKYGKESLEQEAEKQEKK